MLMVVTVDHILITSAFNKPSPPGISQATDWPNNADDGLDFSKPPASVETLQLTAESQRAAHMILRLNDQVVAAFVTSHL
ncbi:hypothetical protein PtA15_10A698 [Puccinia triticina]|uniref:Uncharacterized protein n=1 Tax=Puccinia triticina TaxID=208348 RepID=A0ABY7CXB3_9BASI|nr:uncharacterized protein PtA15_10A698 [Puccinia triticina]WAQ89274.1 hypothetical protein PtA15_10A698 [Puccinia triticina]